MVSLVFLIDPDWFSKAGTLMWPEPTFKIWVATVLLVLVASHSAAATRRRSERRPSEPGELRLTEAQPRLRAITRRLGASLANWEGQSRPASGEVECDPLDMPLAPI